MRLRIANRHGRLITQRREQVGVVAEVGIPRALGAQDHEADRLALFDERHDGLGLEPRELGERPIVRLRQLVAEDHPALVGGEREQRR